VECILVENHLNDNPKTGTASLLQGSPFDRPCLEDSEIGGVTKAMETEDGENQDGIVFSA